jgi:hypothetical protein
LILTGRTEPAVERVVNREKQGARAVANHKDLEVWKQAIELAKEVYEFTTGFPASELYGLASQMRRSAFSIPSNIAEGAARNSDRDSFNFCMLRWAR